MAESKPDTRPIIPKDAFNINTKTLETFNSSTTFTDANILEIVTKLLELINNGKNS